MKGRGKTARTGPTKTSPAQARRSLHRPVPPREALRRGPETGQHLLRQRIATGTRPRPGRSRTSTATGATPTSSASPVRRPLCASRSRASATTSGTSPHFDESDGRPGGMAAVRTRPARRIPGCLMPDSVALRRRRRGRPHRHLDQRRPAAPGRGASSARREAPGSLRAVACAGYRHLRGGTRRQPSSPRRTRPAASRAGRSSTAAARSRSPAPPASRCRPASRSTTTADAPDLDQPLRRQSGLVLREPPAVHAGGGQRALRGLLPHDLAVRGDRRAAGRS